MAALGPEDPLGYRTTAVYDPAGRPQATIDALGHATTTIYDAASRPSPR